MVVSATFIVLAGMMKALSDLSSEGNSALPPQYHKSKTWTNKWVFPLVQNTRPPWLYLWVFTPKYQEKFLYSSSWGVFVSDFWHLCQTYHTFFMISAVVTYNLDATLFNFIAHYLGYILGFSLLYESIKDE